MNRISCSGQVWRSRPLLLPSPCFPITPPQTAQSQLNSCWSHQELQACLYWKWLWWQRWSLSWVLFDFLCKTGHFLVISKSFLTMKHFPCNNHCQCTQVMSSTSSPVLCRHATSISTWCPCTQSRLSAHHLIHTDVCPSQHVYPRVQSGIMHCALPHEWQLQVPRRLHKYASTLPQRWWLGPASGILASPWHGCSLQSFPWVPSVSCSLLIVSAFPLWCPLWYLVCYSVRH